MNHIVVYEYGGPPGNGYDYMIFVGHMAPVLPENDGVFFYNGGLQWRANHNEIPLTLFRNICHWKSPRRFGMVRNNQAQGVNQRWANAMGALNGPPFEEDAVTMALGELTALQGVGVRTASALLTAWNPQEFGIMDRRTLTVLDMPQYYTSAAYVTFRNRLLQVRAELGLENLALRQIELAIWHYYPIQEAGQNQWADA